MSTTSQQSPNTLKLTEQADQARLNRELGVALVWINTAAILESAGQTSDVAGPLNARLLGLIFDGATLSEDLALKCGNVTEKHLGWLESMHEASALLLSRLSAESNEAAAVALMNGHLANLLKLHAIKSQSLRMPTSTVQTKIFVSIMHEIREQAAKLAPESCTARDTASRLQTLNHLVGNANAQMLSFPLRCLSDWDAGHFYVTEAVRYFNDLPAGAVELVGHEHELQKLRNALLVAQTALTAKDYHGSRLNLAEARSLVNTIGGFARSL